MRNWKHWSVLLLSGLFFACEEGPSDSCTWAYDGECDEGGACAYGTDATDCGYAEDQSSPGSNTGDTCYSIDEAADESGSGTTCTQGPCSEFFEGTPQGTCPTANVWLCCELGGSQVGTSVRVYSNCDTDKCESMVTIEQWNQICEGYSGTVYQGNCGGGSSPAPSEPTSPSEPEPTDPPESSGGACVTVLSDGSYSCLYVLSVSECTYGDYWADHDCSNVEQYYY